MKNPSTASIDRRIRSPGKACHITEEQYRMLADQVFFPYALTDHWIIRLDRSKAKEDEEKINYTAVAIATRLEVTAASIDMDTKEFTVEIQIYTGRESFSHRFEASILTQRGLNVLLTYGALYHEKQWKDLLDYLVIARASAPITQTYTRLGWCEVEGKRAFKSGTLIAPNGTLPCQYMGGHDLYSHGNLNDWLDMVRKEVLGNTPLTCVLLLGFASPLLDFLNRLYDLGCLFFNLCNSSSKGKTTAAMLAASVFSNPKAGTGTLINFNATQNALLKFASMCNGHTLVFDEVGTAQISNFRTLLYMLCDGQDKMRLKPDSSMKERFTFSSFIISTAEFTLLDENAPNGLKARVYELSDVFTTSHENSVAIKRTVLEHHGVAGAPFIRYILDRDIEKDYQQAANDLKEAVHSCHELTDRMIDKLAVILQTSRYVNDCYLLKLDEQAIINYLVNLESTIQIQRSPEERLLDAVQQELVRNGHLYIWNQGFSGNRAQGRVERKATHVEVSMTEEVVNRLLYEQGLDKNQVMRALSQQHRLICERDRQTKRVNLFARTNSSNKVKTVCYVFRLPLNSIGEPQKKEKVFSDEITDADFDF